MGDGRIQVLFFFHSFSVRFFNLRWSCFQLEITWVFFSTFFLAKKQRWRLTFMSQARWIEEIFISGSIVWNDQSLTRWEHEQIQPIWRQPSKIYMEPENTPLKEENPLPNHHFQVNMLIFGGVSFQSTPGSTWKYYMTICLSLNTCWFFYWLFGGQFSVLQKFRGVGDINNKPIICAQWGNWLTPKNWCGGSIQPLQLFM